jgi:uncharacterized ion transporter superfamily protein YfcC
MRLRQYLTILSGCLAHAYLVVYAQKKRSEPLFSYLIARVSASAPRFHTQSIFGSWVQWTKRKKGFVFGPFLLRLLTKTVCSTVCSLEWCSVVMMMMILLLFLQKQNLAFAVYQFRSVLSLPD